MAFADASTEKIIAYLGYPNDADSITEVEASLTAISATADATAFETRIEGYLTRLEALKTALDTQITTEGSTLITGLRTEGRRYVKLVSTATGLGVRADVWGSTEG